MKYSCAVKVALEPETKEKAKFLARLGGRSLAGYMRQTGQAGDSGA